MPVSLTRDLGLYPKVSMSSWCRNRGLSNGSPGQTLEQTSFKKFFCIQIKILFYCTAGHVGSQVPDQGSNTASPPMLKVQESQPQDHQGSSLRLLF